MSSISGLRGSRDFCVDRGGHRLAAAGRGGHAGIGRSLSAAGLDRELPRRVDPELHGVLDIAQRGFPIIAMRHAPGQFGGFGDERPVVVAP